MHRSTCFTVARAQREVGARTESYGGGGNCGGDKDLVPLLLCSDGQLWSKSGSQESLAGYYAVACLAGECVVDGDVERAPPAARVPPFRASRKIATAPFPPLYAHLQYHLHADNAIILPPEKKRSLVW